MGWHGDGGGGGGGGGGTTVVPLARTIIVDPQTTVTSPDGSFAKPEPTTDDACTAMGTPSTDPDGQLPKAIVVYAGVDTSTPAIPAGYSLLELTGVAAILAGAVTWANVAVAHGAASRSLSVYDMVLAGGLTATDDGTQGTLGLVNTVVVGTLDLTGCTATGVIVQGGDFEGPVTLNTAAGAKQITATGTTFNGAVRCEHGVFSACDFAAITITARTGSTSTIFRGCRFGGVTTLVGLDEAGNNGPFEFDGPSWDSFQELGGIVTADATTRAYVQGGFLAAVQHGAPLVDGDTAVELAGDCNGGTPSPGFERGGNSYRLPAGTLTADGSMQWSLDGANNREGDTLNVLVEVQAHDYAVLDQDGATLVTIAAGTTGFALLKIEGGVVTLAQSVAGGVGGGFSGAAGANFLSGTAAAVIGGDDNATCSAPAFTLTSGSNAVDVEGTMVVEGDGSVTTVQFQLQRDGAPIGGSLIAPIGFGNNASLTLRIIESPGAGAHVYSMVATRNDGAALVLGSWQYVVAERQVVAI